MPLIRETFSTVTSVSVIDFWTLDVVINYLIYEVIWLFIGKDNYLGNLADNAFNDMAMNYQQRYNKNPSRQNVAYYHR